MTRTLAIDYGAKRVGMAYSDVLKITINPLPTVQEKECFIAIVEFSKKENVGEIVFGYPEHIDGKPTKVAKKIDQLIIKLNKALPTTDIYKIDEAFTSRDARSQLIASGKSRSFRQKKENIDQMSAMLILKEYLNQG